MIAVFYFIFSSFSLFIPTETVVKFGFSQNNLAAVITYPFLHVTLTHLIGNLSLLLALGFVVEEKLRLKDYYAIFFVSAMLSGVLFLMLSPNVILAGASAAISGLLIPACLIDFKKTIAYLILFSLAATVLSPITTDAITGVYSSSKQKITEIQQTFNQTLAQKQQVFESISALDDKLNRGEITITEYNKSKQELAQITENLTKQERALSADLNKTAATLSNIEEGISREKTSKTSFTVHLFGSFIGLAYIAIFRRDVLWNSGYQVSRLERWLKKRRKRLRKVG